MLMQIAAFAQTHDHLLICIDNIEAESKVVV